MIGWLRRRVLYLGDRHHGSLDIGDFLQLWWRPLSGRRGRRRGIVLRFDPPFMEGFIFSISRHAAGFSWTDHNTYLREVWTWRTEEFQREMEKLAYRSVSL